MNYDEHRKYWLKYAAAASSKKWTLRSLVGGCCSELLLAGSVFEFSLNDIFVTVTALLLAFLVLLLAVLIHGFSGFLLPRFACLLLVL